MVEALGGRPRRKLRLTQFGEVLLETGDLRGGLRVARGYRATRAGIATLEVHFTDAEAHDAAFAGAEQAILPEGGQGAVGRRVLGGPSFGCVCVRNRSTKMNTGVPCPYNFVARSPCNVVGGSVNF